MFEYLLSVISVLKRLHMASHRHFTNMIRPGGIYKMRYWDYYPSKSILKLMKERRIPVMAASDAHHPSEVALLLDEVHEYLNEIGYPKELIGFN